MFRINYDNYFSIYCYKLTDSIFRFNSFSISYIIDELFDIILGVNAENIDILNTNDAIVSPSKFNYRIFAHTPIKKPIFYWPHCIDTNLYSEKIRPLKIFDKFTFLFMGTWKDRKGCKLLMEAWLKEFRDCWERTG